MPFKWEYVICTFLRNSICKNVRKYWILNYVLETFNFWQNMWFTTMNFTEEVNGGNQSWWHTDVKYEETDSEQDSESDNICS